MNPVECYFCKRKCRPFIEDKNSHAPFRKSWRCDYHGAVVVKHLMITSTEPHTLSRVILSVIHNDHTYDCSFFLGSLTEKFRIDLNHRPPRTIETIVSLDFYPEITPENIAAKLPTYLLFS